MSKLLTLKSFLTLDQAAQRLGSILNEEITASDIYQLGVEGKLQISFWAQGVIRLKGKSPSDDPDVICLNLPDSASDFELFTGLVDITINDLRNHFHGEFIYIQFDTEENDYRYKTTEQAAHFIRTIKQLASGKDLNDFGHEVLIEGLKQIHKNLETELAFLLDSAKPEAEALKISKSDLVVTCNNLATFESEYLHLESGGEAAEMTNMRALALMAWILSENKPAQKISGRPNASAIAKAVDSLAQRFFGDDVRGFTAFHKKLGKALNLLEGDPNEGRPFDP